MSQKLPRKNKKTDERDELVRIIIDSRDASQDQMIPRWALRHFIIQELIIRDITNNEWCSKDGKRLPIKS